MKRKYIYVLLLALSVLLLSSCVDQTSDTTNDSGIAPSDSESTFTSQKTEDSGKSEDSKPGEDSTTLEPPQNKPDPEPTWQVTRTFGEYKIVANTEDTGWIRGRCYKGNKWEGFTLKDGYIPDSGVLTYSCIGYIEETFETKIEKFGFWDMLEKEDISSLGTYENDVKYVHFNGAFGKRFASINGALYSENRDTLYFVPKGLTGEYVVREGTAKIDPSTFKNTKLTKVLIPSTVADYKTATDGINGLTVQIYSSPLTNIDESYGEGDIRVVGERNGTNVTGYIELSGKKSSFTLSGDHLYGDVELTLISYIENAFGLRIRSLTFDSDDCVPSVLPMALELHVENYYIKSSSKYTSVDGVLYSADKKTLVLFPAGRTGEYTALSEVQSIAACAFDHSSLSKLILPKSMEGKNLEIIGVDVVYK